MAESLTVRVRIDGAKEMLTRLNRIGPEANKQIRTAAYDIASSVARQAEIAGRVEGRQAALVAKTVRARRDRVPVVIAGGGKRVGRRRKAAGKMVFGSEFGATALPQYKPHLGGKEGYWFFPTIERNEGETAKRWTEAADAILATLGGGPHG